MLLGLVDRAMDRLRPLAEAHRIREDRVAALRPDMAAFDDSLEGDRLRRQAMACDRGIHRNLASILKGRKEGATAQCDNLQPVDAGYAPALAGVDQFLQNEPTRAFDRAFQDGPGGCYDQALQNEPTGGDAGQGPRIEPTADNADHSSQDQSTADFRDLRREHEDIERDLENEPTDREQDLENEPTDDDRDLRDESGDCTLDDKPPGKRMEWFQMMAHHKRVEEENLRKWQELDQESRDGKGIGTPAHPDRASSAGLDA